MSDRQGYKHTPLGWIPQEWEIMELKDIVSKPIVYGIVQAGPNIQDGIPYIRSTDVGGEINKKSLYKTSIAIAKKYKRSEVAPGDIVFSLRGNIGEISLVPEDLPVANLTQGTARISVNKGLEGKFIYYSLQFPAVVKNISYKSKGSTFKEITLENLRKICLAIPSRKEQRKIATIFNEWEEAITKMQLLIVHLQQRNKGLMQHLLNAKYNDTHLPLCELLIEKSSSVNEATIKFEVLSITKNGLVSQKEYFKKEVASDDRRKYKIVESGDVVMSGLNFWMGSIDMVSEYKYGIVSPAYKVFIVNTKYASVRFFKHFVRSEQMLKILISCSIIGASIVRRNFDREMFDNWLLKLPSLKVQEQIADVLDSAKAELILTKQKLGALEGQKQGLIQQLLSGEVRVKI
jgi:type I restriction enzyme S subunit